MKYPHLEGPLRTLLLKYRDIPFREWERMHGERRQFHDYSSTLPEHEGFWQAHTDVLEVEIFRDGRRYANVSITMYPKGIHSVPPAPHAGFLCFEDGTCDVGTPWSEDYVYTQPRSEG